MLDEDQKNPLEAETKIIDAYKEKIDSKIQEAQKSHDVPSVYAFNIGEKKFVCTLPRSVMAQRRIVYMQRAYAATGALDAEEALLTSIVENTTLNGRALNINDLEYDEIEVLRVAYTDELILPLFLGGGQAIKKYMAEVVGTK